MPGPRSRTRITSAGDGPDLDDELDTPAAGILNGVAGDLRGGGGDPRLVELGEAQQPGDLPRPLPGQHDVGLEADLQSSGGACSWPTAPPLPRHQNRHVVAASLVVPVEDPGDQARVPLARPG